MSERFYLESSSGQTLLPRRLNLEAFPATVGRHPDCNVQLNVERISRIHARFELINGQLMVEDLGSTNGTFINHRRIEEQSAVKTGDVVHMADHEFRLMREQVDTEPMAETSSSETVIGMQALPHNFPLQMAAFFDLLEHGKVDSFCQKILRSDGSLFGYELLGRSAHDELTEGPGQLFTLASALNAEVKLSRLFRRKAFEAAAAAGVNEPLFFNNHPAECEDFDALMVELAELRALYPQLKLVFEVHEAAVTDQEAMASVRKQLQSMNVQLAYDDFGAGQARLLELIEVPPDFLKFDIALVRDLEDRDSAKYQLLSTLNELISAMGIQTLAEGIETEVNASLCREIGIDLFQGFLYHRPQPITELA
ncbi:MAG: EAL domain-containing protein [Pseudomonadota bacterium]